MAKRIRLSWLITSKSWHHTMWLTPKGKFIDLNTMTHFDWIAENFNELFPEYIDEAYDESGEIKPEYVFETPIEEGWIHIRNHSFDRTPDISMQGTKRAFRKHGDDLYEMIMDIWENSGSDSVFVILNYGADPTGRDTFELPDDIEDLEKAL